MNRSRLIMRRLAQMIPVLIGVSVVVFLFLHLIPGDPASAMLGDHAIADSIARLRVAYGLDQSWPQQYVIFVDHVLQGDLGRSIRSNNPITQELAQRFPATIELTVAAMLIAVLVGIPAGIISAVKRYGRVDYVLTSATMVLISTPTFVLGLILIYVIGVTFRLLPIGGMQTLGKPFSVADLAGHLVMPVLILGFAYAAPLMRYTRSSMLEVLDSEYVTTARAKGLGERIVLIRHALRNALIPIITVVGYLLPELVAGAIITEQVFSWPGMGLLAVRAASQRDPSLMMGIVLMISVAVLIASILTDVAYTYADPRIRLVRNG